ncbi:hypothetical protein [Paraburkholderia sp. BL18I3N2]|uniref:hypothetical protein n=1 Tax=Paraburkholderia sp. BL18I3N2 TaxID=1938799 RepID=UPI0011B27699|nr:hypothetical protein [Paraburkholderia sp. BL18I3N2]
MLARARQCGDFNEPRECRSSMNHEPIDRALPGRDIHADFTALVLNADCAEFGGAASCHSHDRMHILLRGDCRFGVVINATGLACAFSALAATLTPMLPLAPRSASTPIDAADAPSFALPLCALGGRKRKTGQEARIR